MSSLVDVARDAGVHAGAGELRLLVQMSAEFMSSVSFFLDSMWAQI